MKEQKLIFTINEKQEMSIEFEPSLKINRSDNDDALSDVEKQMQYFIAKLSSYIQSSISKWGEE